MRLTRRRSPSTWRPTSRWTESICCATTIYRGCALPPRDDAQALSGSVHGQLRDAGGRKIGVEVGYQIGFQFGVRGIVPQIAPLQRVFAKIVELALATVVADIGHRRVDAKCRVRKRKIVADAARRRPVDGADETVAID